LHTTCERDREINVLFATNSCLNRFILLRKYTKNHNRNGKDCIFKDFVLDSAKTGKGLAQRGDDNDSTDNEKVLQQNSTDIIVTLKTLGDGAN